MAMPETKSAFATIEEAIEEIRAGRMVVVCDDEDRENEGDLTLAAQFATPEAINFMATHARGLICLALTPERCDELGLDLMAAKNETPLQTAFTVAIEAREGVTTGISAADRAHTIQVAVDPETKPHDLVQPGHVFPLKAKAGGVLERTGQTEAAVDLARLAGVDPGRGDLRDHERRRHDGPGPGPDPVLPGARAEDDHGRRPDRLPPHARTSWSSAWSTPGCRPRSASSPRSATARSSTTSTTSRWSRARSTARGRSRPGPLRVPHRRRVPLAALRLRRAARGCAGDDRAGGPRRAALPLAGGPWDRPAQQAARLQAPGGGPRHRRRQPQARSAGGPARLRDRRPDPGRPRAQLDPDPDQQPEEDPRPRGLRPVGRRAGPDPLGPEPAQRGLPERQARQARPHPPPPGAAARRRDDPRRAGQGRRGEMPEGLRPTTSASSSAVASGRSASRRSTRTSRSG